MCSVVKEEDVQLNGQCALLQSGALWIRNHFSVHPNVQSTSSRTLGLTEVIVCLVVLLTTNSMYPDLYCAVTDTLVYNLGCKTTTLTFDQFLILHHYGFFVIIITYSVWTSSSFSFSMNYVMPAVPVLLTESSGPSFPWFSKRSVLRWFARTNSHLSFSMHGVTNYFYMR